MYLSRKIIALFLMAAMAYTQDFRIWQYAEVGPQERLQQNVYLIGREVKVDGMVKGDVIAIGENIDVNNLVDQDLHILGIDTRVTGIVKGDFRGIGLSIYLSDSLMGEVLALGNYLEVEPGAYLSTGGSLIGSNVKFDGTSADRLIIRADRVIINGTVNGDLEVYAYEKLEYGAGARIEGDLMLFTREYQEPPPGMVKGKINYEELSRSSLIPDLNSPGWISARFLVSLIIASLFISLFPSFVLETRDRLQEGLFKFILYGTIGLFVLPMISLLAFLMLFTYPIGFLSLGTFFLFIYLGKFILALWIGSYILHLIGSKYSSSFLELTVGLILFQILLIIPYLGFLAFILELCGLGLMLSAFLSLIKRNQLPKPGI